MNKYFFFIILILIFIGLIAYKSIESLFKNDSIFIILQIFITGLIINIGLFLFIILHFSKTNILDGLPGGRGVPGPKGPIGLPDACVQCEGVSKTLGQGKIDYDKTNTLLVKLPQVPVEQPGRPS